MDTVSPNVSHKFSESFFDDLDVSRVGWQVVSGQRGDRPRRGATMPWRPERREAEVDHREAISKQRAYDLERRWDGETVRDDAGGESGEVQTGDIDDDHDGDGCSESWSERTADIDADMKSMTHDELAGENQRRTASNFTRTTRDPQRFRNTRKAKPAVVKMIGTWNVEGISLETPSKLEQIKKHMQDEGMSVLCMQETHVSGAPYYSSEGYLVICSGGDAAMQHAGMGFVVASSLRHALLSFKQLFSRLASIKIRVSSGILVIIAAYAL